MEENVKANIYKYRAWNLQNLLYFISMGNQISAYNFFSKENISCNVSFPMKENYRNNQ